LEVEKLEAWLKSSKVKPSLLYCIPRYHNPTSVCLSPARAYLSEYERERGTERERKREREERVRGGERERKGGRERKREGEREQ